MQFESGHLYHIYNQGNNRQKIFLDRENYLFFLRKIRKHVIPFTDILAWCLMPNHFHLMVHVNFVVVDERLVTGITPGATDTPGATQSRARSNPTNTAIPSPTPSRARNQMSFNKSIGIMLASYTRAINKQQDWSGSLFRSETKAVCLTEIDGISPVWITNMGITEFTDKDPDVQYPNICFNYIHNNPVKDGLVSRKEEWEFSSYADFIGIRNGNLINRNRIKEFGLRELP
jgi:putative transposase